MPIFPSEIKLYAKAYDTVVMIAHEDLSTIIENMKIQEEA